MFLGLSIVGALVSGLIQYIKIKYKVEGTEAHLILIVLSLIVGGLFSIANEMGWLQTAMQLFVTADIIYRYVIKTIMPVQK